MRIGALSLAGVLLLAACSGGTEDASDPSPVEQTANSPATPEVSAGVLACDSVIDEANAVPSDYKIVLDSVALPAVESASRALQAVQHPDGPAPNFLAKTGLLVSPGAAFTIEVNHSPDIALIGWGSTAEGFVTRISSTGCEGKEWLAFAGGILVREPMCAELTITVNGDRESIRVGAGAPCEGQQSPPDV